MGDVQVDREPQGSGGLAGDMGLHGSKRGMAGQY